SWDYGQQAVVCIIRHEKPHRNAAIEHFWPQGPFAVLPMADDAQGRHRSSIVFTEHGTGKDSLMRLSDQAFQAALQVKLPESYGAVTEVSRRAAFPLSLVHAASYVGERSVLVADAAHGIHPIAGQGLNLGFRDVKELSDILGDAYEEGADLGDPELL